MARQPKIGMNRTGAAVQPRHTKALRAASSRSKPEGKNGAAISTLRRSYTDGEVIGSVPAPTTLKGVGKALIEMISGARAPVMMDRLSERLCSERTAVRLYESLLVKHHALGSWPGGPKRGDIETLRDEELENFRYLYRTIEEMGADPTALTPSADLAGESLSGVVQVIADPRTDLLQCLEAMQLAELSDNSHWESLVHLYLRMGHEDMAERFQEILAMEARHLSLVRSWVFAGISNRASMRATFEKRSTKSPTKAKARGDGRRKSTKQKPSSKQSRPRAR